MIKYARADVLGYSGSKRQIHQATLARFSSYEDYRTDDDYLYVRVRAISSRVNKNHDGWPADELQKSYRTFIGKPIFVDHHNSDPKRARGVVVDAALHVEDLEKVSSTDPYYSSAPDNHKPPTWIELLLEVDAKSFPKLAKAIIDGDIDGVSMGANVERSRCSVCANWARSPEEYCQHVRSKGAYFDHYDQTGAKTSKRSYEDCYDIGFFEISFVFDPADETALRVGDPIYKKRAAKIAAIQTEGNYTNTEVNLNPEPDIERFVRAAVQEAMGKGAEIGDALSWAAQRAVDHGFDRHRVSTAVRSVWQDFGALEKTMGEVGVNGEGISADMIPAGSYNAPFTAVPDKLHSELQQRYPNDPYTSRKTARPEMIPQSEKMIAPSQINTLRQERTCPVCGQQGMEDGKCSVCEFVEQPEGFDDPDLTKARQTDQTQEQAGQGVQPVDPTQQGQPAPLGQPGPGGQPSPMPVAAHTSDSTRNVKSDMSEWRVVVRKKASGQNSGGRVNSRERPILPVTRQNSDKPLRPRTVADSKAPVESKNKEKVMSAKTRKTADGATPAGSGVAADKRVDVEGVGAVDDSPEKDTKHEDVSKKVDIERIPTDTWQNGEGDSLGQHEPVSTDVDVKAGDNGIGGPIGSPVSSVREAAPVTPHGEAPSGSFPDHDPDRVDLTAPIAEPVGPNTMTWAPGHYDTDMHVGDPVTQDDSNEIGGPIGQPLSSTHTSRDHIFRAIKVAETEVELGITDADQKFPRAAELEGHTPEELVAIETTLSKVKTAGLGKPVATQKTASRMPSFHNVASVDPSAHTATVNEDDAGLFL